MCICQCQDDSSAFYPNYASVTSPRHAIAMYLPVSLDEAMCILLPFYSPKPDLCLVSFSSPKKKKKKKKRLVVDSDFLEILLFVLASSALHRYYTYTGSKSPAVAARLIIHEKDTYLGRLEA